MTDNPPDLSQYQVRYVAACPECLGDCRQEGPRDWWCPACKHMWDFYDTAYHDETEWERD